MGLFDFMSVAGADKVTKTDEISPERLDQLRKESIEKSIARLDIDNEKVRVTVKGEVATLAGTAPSQEVMEKLVLCAGNQHGIGKVDCQIIVDAAPVAATGKPAAAAVASTDAASTFYTVKAGDNLSKIAKAVYGDANKYPVIFEANKPMLSDPDKIYPGQALRIPHL
jgi:nucleoid-associated protein YgaU